MTTTMTPPAQPAEALRHLLEPVRRALIDDAVDEADRILSAAANSAKDTIATATALADDEVDRARHRAELSALTHAQLALARVRNDGRRAVLATQEQLRQQLVDEVRSAVESLRQDPHYPALLDYLETLARNQLGTDAVIERDPRPGGGIIAEAGSRRVDYCLARLADRSLDTLADDVAELWS